MLICKTLLHPAQRNYCQLLPFAFHIFVRNAFADMWGGEQRVSFLSLTANFKQSASFSCPFSRSPEGRPIWLQLPQCMSAHTHIHIRFSLRKICYRNVISLFIRVFGFTITKVPLPTTLFRSAELSIIKNFIYAHCEYTRCGAGYAKVSLCMQPSVFALGYYLCRAE